LDSRSSCLSHLSAEIIGMYHHTQLKLKALNFAFKTGIE
jgi:hypothetical protein